MYLHIEGPQLVELIQYTAEFPPRSSRVALEHRICQYPNNFYAVFWEKF